MKSSASTMGVQLRVWTAALALAGTAGCVARTFEDGLVESDARDAPADEARDVEGCTLNDWACDADTHTSTGLSAGPDGTSYRKRCQNSSDCAPNEMCAVSLQIGALVGMVAPLCVPKCTRDGQCRSVAGYTLFQNNQSTNCTEQVSCVVACSSDDDCPAGVSCWNGTLCAGPFF